MKSSTFIQIMASNTRVHFILTIRILLAALLSVPIEAGNEGKVIFS